MLQLPGRAAVAAAAIAEAAMTAADTFSEKMPSVQRSCCVSAAIWERALEDKTIKRKKVLLKTSEFLQKCQTVFLQHERLFSHIKMWRRLSAKGQNITSRTHQMSVRVPTPSLMK